MSCRTPLQPLYLLFSSFMSESFISKKPSAVPRVLCASLCPPCGVSGRKNDQDICHWVGRWEMLSKPYDVWWFVTILLRHSQSFYSTASFSPFHHLSSLFFFSFEICAVCERSVCEWLLNRLAAVRFWTLRTRFKPEPKPNVQVQFSQIVEPEPPLRFRFGIRANLNLRLRTWTFFWRWELGTWRCFLHT